MPRATVSDSLIQLLFAFIIIYVGAYIIYAVNSLLGFLFVLFGLYLIVSGVRKGGGGRFL